MDKATQARERQHKAETKTRKDKIKTKTEWLTEAQAAVNAYVRIRDRGKPCVSCGKPDNGTHQRHASHYRSVGACSSLRFNLKNVYASCQQCNTSKSGNLLEYRIRLKARYGESLVEWLESQNEPKRYETDYLIRLRDVFRKRVNQLKKRQP
jgi:5-methylcytosine-specific restriction endonuclease McrA